jgi:hypothetical protein
MRHQREGSRQGNAQLAGRPSALATSTMFMTLVLIPLPRPSIWCATAADGAREVSAQGGSDTRLPLRPSAAAQHAAQQSARQHQVDTTSTRGSVAAHARSGGTRSATPNAGEGLARKSPPLRLDAPHAPCSAVPAFCTWNR